MGLSIKKALEKSSTLGNQFLAKNDKQEGTKKCINEKGSKNSGGFINKTKTKKDKYVLSQSKTKNIWALVSTFWK